MAGASGGGSEDARGMREVLRRAWTGALVERPSAGALLLGHEPAVRVFRRVSGWWGSAIGAMAVVVAVALHDTPTPGVDPTGALVVGITATILGVTFLLIGDRASERSLTALSLGALVGMVLEVRLLGPAFEMAMVIPAVACIQALLYLPRRVTIAGQLLVVGSYAAVVLGTSGYPAPGVRLLIFTAGLVATSTAVRWIIGQIARLSLKERRAQAELSRTTQALAEANAQLEEMVGKQGEEIGSLQQLRRFVSPQVAEVLLQHGIESLAPHRGRIAVIFCDLRGFTDFSSAAEPEEVMEVLDQYYALVGRALQARDATIGSFAGDGIMAYFGDPVPCADPAGTAVEMAAMLNVELQEVVAGWWRRGFHIGCGMGIAYGFATIGPVGFDGRTDYTAVGPTVNLASRLCSMATDGEILIDGRAHAAVEDRVESEERLLEVRGFRMPVPAHCVRAWRGSSTRQGVDAVT